MVRAYSEIPGKLGIPFFGETLSIFRDQELFYSNQYSKYGTISKARLMGMDFVILISPEANQIVLKDQAHKFSSRIGWNFLEPLIGDGVLLRDGLDHQSLRKLLHPPFHGSALNNLSLTIQKSTNKLLDDWDREPFCMFEVFRSMTLTIACQTILGSENLDICELSHYFFEFVDGMKTILRLNVPHSRFYKAKVARSKLEKVIYEIILRRRTLNTISYSGDILGLLLSTKAEDGTSLSDSEIVTQIIQLLFGGHETVATLLTWLIFELTDDSHGWRGKIMQELDSLPQDFSNLPIYLQKLPNLDLVIKEAERLYPPLYFIPRGVLESFEYMGYHIPAGQNVMLSPFMTNRLPDIFDKPELFDPERYFPGREEHKKYPFALIPYGGGYHQCIGKELARLEIKIITISILKKFIFKVYPSPEILKPVIHSRRYHKHLKMVCESI